MADAWGSLHVDVWEDEILIALSDFCAVYVKPKYQPQLILKRRTAREWAPGRAPRSLRAL